MCEVLILSVGIFAVTGGSPAENAGIIAGDRIVSINGEPVTDEIDYQSLSAVRNPEIIIIHQGESRCIKIRKDEWEPIGLCLDETEAMKPRHCRNRCLFCFVDQLPAHVRDTMRVKDDDWRMSLMMGNYVTLTNVSDAELDRIIRRHCSPLYISVHCTDPDLRTHVLGTPRARRLMGQLQRLSEGGIEFHCQCVLCPGINDGEALDRTIR